jgi:hypothetical protein
VRPPQHHHLYNSSFCVRYAIINLDSSLWRHHHPLQYLVKASRLQPFARVACYLTCSQTGQWASLNRLCSSDRVALLQFGSALADATTFNELCACSRKRRVTRLTQLHLQVCVHGLNINRTDHCRACSKQPSCCALIASGSPLRRLCGALVVHAEQVQPSPSQLPTTRFSQYADHRFARS